MGRALVDIAGQRFARSEAVRFLGKAGNFEWECRCDCGNTFATSGYKLRTGRVKSCGCLLQDAAGSYSITHGLSKFVEYAIWAGIIKRCHGSQPHAGYSARGISVCPAWRSEFEAFLRDMGPRPSDKHSIDRIDNDGDYEPGNCRWATKTEQARNKRSNRIVCFQGRNMPLSEAAELAGIKYDVVWDRLNLGWTVDAALAKKTIGRWA